MTTDDTEKKRIVIGGILDVATIDYRDEISGDTLITWSFGGMFIDMARDSNHWAILDRQAVFHLGSKYSVLLFQHIASLQNLKHVTSKRFTVAELRAVLGVADDKMPRFSHLKHRAIEPAIAEINSDLTRLHLTVTYHKIGRTVAEVEIAWEVKEDLAKVKAELDRPKVGRKARQEGAEDKPVLAFPASGSIRYSEPWITIAKEHGNGKDVNKIADEFRRWWAPKPLDANTIEKAFKTFCKRSKI